MIECFFFSSDILLKGIGKRSCSNSIQMQICMDFYRTRFTTALCLLYNLYLRTIWRGEVRWGWKLLLYFSENPWSQKMQVSVELIAVLVGFVKAVSAFFTGLPFLFCLMQSSEVLVLFFWILHFKRYLLLCSLLALIFHELLKKKNSLVW